MCYRCEKSGHYAPPCKHKESVCSKYGKVGHLKKVCHSKRTKPLKTAEWSGSESFTESDPKNKEVNAVAEEGTDEYDLMNVT